MSLSFFGSISPFKYILISLAPFYCNGDRRMSRYCALLVLIMVPLCYILRKSYICRPFKKKIEDIPEEISLFLGISIKQTARSSTFQNRPGDRRICAAYIIYIHIQELDTFLYDDVQQQQTMLFKQIVMERGRYLCNTSIKYKILCRIQRCCLRCRVAKDE